MVDCTVGYKSCLLNGFMAFSPCFEGNIVKNMMRYLMLELNIHVGKNNFQLPTHLFLLLPN